MNTLSRRICRTHRGRLPVRPPLSACARVSSLLMAYATACLLIAAPAGAATPSDDTTTTRVFIFAAQSNMVGSDSKVDDIKRFPPFAGLEAPQDDVRFSYCLGREQKNVSAGWEALRPLNNTVGPELSFAATVTDAIDAPIAIIKVAAGGTHLGGDWNPDHPEGFQMYPLALKQVHEALASLKDRGINLDQILADLRIHLSVSRRES